MSTITNALSMPSLPTQSLEFGALAAAEDDLDVLCDSAARTIVTGLGVDCCHIYKPSADRHDLQFVAGHGSNEEWAQHALRIARHSLATGAPILRESVGGGRLAPKTPRRSLAAATEHGDVSGMSVVIKGETAPFGVLAIFNSTPRTFSRGDLEFAQSVAGALTQVLLRAHHRRDRVRLATVVATANEAIIGITRYGRIFSWNEAAESLYGYASTDTIGRSLTEMFRSGLPSEFLTMFDPGGQSVSLGPFETVLPRSDGTLVDSEVRLVPIVPPDGPIVAASMVARDVREERRANRNLQMHADILAHIPAAVFVWRLDDCDNPSSLRLVLANRAAADVAGLSLDDSAGLQFADVPLGISEGDDPEPYAAVARTARVHDFGERWLGRPDGSRQAYHVQAFPLPDQCVGVVFHNVTECRELGDQLQHAQRLEVIGRLAGGIAHDFNNLLTVIAGYAELLQPAIADNKLALEDLRQIEHAWKSAQQLTRQLLAFGRRQVLRPKNLDLAAMVRSARGLLKPLIGEDVQLIVLGQDPVTVCCDAGQIEQVLLNLAVNARDAMPAGGKLFIESSLVLVSDEPVHGHGEVPPGAYGMLEVTDTGTGIDAATLARMFEPFFTTKEAGKGTGLGLATVYGIVKQSAGHITVASEPGEGTTFRMYFPAIDSPEDQPEAEDRVTALHSTGSQTILVVDDDDAVRILVCNVLTRAGYTVLSSGGPLDALQLAERFTGSIDLLLTDVVMPVQSGAELAARLMVSVDGLRVLYMSGYARHSVGHCKISNDSLLIHKPFSPGDLLDAVRAALDPPESRVKCPVRQTIM